MFYLDAISKMLYTGIFTNGCYVVWNLLQIIKGNEGGQISGWNKSCQELIIIKAERSAHGGSFSILHTYVYFGNFIIKHF